DRDISLSGPQDKASDAVPASLGDAAAPIDPEKGSRHGRGGHRRTWRAPDASDACWAPRAPPGDLAAPAVGARVRVAPQPVAQSALVTLSASIYGSVGSEARRDSLICANSLSAASRSSAISAASTSGDGRFSVSSSDSSRSQNTSRLALSRASSSS